MAKIAAVLGVFILDQNQNRIRAGTLTRDANGGVSFVVSEDYLRDRYRPILSLGWHDTRSDENSQKRLADRRDKIGLRGALPPWFAGLLPEGALRDLVLTEMGPGDHDHSTSSLGSEATCPERSLLVRRPTTSSQPAR
jgi:serine/threonine-protein kinase HipA